jgi:membrane protein DedA with SNARE-associated domain
MLLMLSGTTGTGGSEGGTSTGSTDIGGLTGWILDIVEQLGAVGLGVLTFVENVFPPLPSEIFLPAGGYLASQGDLSLIGAWVAATIGSMLAAWLFFWIGRTLGAERIEKLLTKVPLMNGDDLDRAEDWFHRHGDASVLVGRLVPGVRSLVSIPAGSYSMGAVRFSVLTLLGSGMWNALLIGAGWVLGNQWQDLESWSTWLDVALVAAVVIAIGKFVWTRRDRIGSEDERPEATRA